MGIPPRLTWWAMGSMRRPTTSSTRGPSCLVAGRAEAQQGDYARLPLLGLRAARTHGVRAQPQGGHSVRRPLVEDHDGRAGGQLPDPLQQGEPLTAQGLLAPQ